MFSKKRGATTDYWVIRVGEIALGLVLLAAGFLFIMSVLHGTEWKNSYLELQKISSKIDAIDKIGSSINIPLEFGTSTDVVVLTNRGSFESMMLKVGISFSKFDCPDGYKSILVAVKKAENAPSLTEVGTAIAGQDRLTVEQWARAFAGLNEATHCVSLRNSNSTFVGSGLTIPITEKSRKYCLNVYKQSESEYLIQADPIEKSSQCPDTSPSKDATNLV